MPCLVVTKHLKADQEIRRLQKHQIGKEAILCCGPMRAVIHCILLD